MKTRGSLPWRTWSCRSFVGCALPRLALHRGQNDGQRLGGLRGGLGAQGAAGGRVGVMGVVHRHTADHVGPLACSRAAGENKGRYTPGAFSSCN